MKLDIELIKTVLQGATHPIIDCNVRWDNDSGEFEVRAHIVANAMVKLPGNLLELTVEEAQPNLVELGKYIQGSLKDALFQANAELSGA